METFFSNPLFFGEDILNQLHLFIGAWFDLIMVIITGMGSGLLFSIIIPIIYWCYDKKIAIKILIIFILSSTINKIIKNFFNNPRPDPAFLLEGIKELNIKYIPHGPGFPSGHTQSTIAFWGAASYFIRKKAIIIISILMMILIPYSRLFLGVHFLGDIFGGFIIAAVLLMLLIPLITLIEKYYFNLHKIILLLIIIIFPLLVYYIFPGYHINSLMGSLSGFLIGSIFESEKIAFNPKNRFLAQLIKIGIGLTGLLIIRFGFLSIFPINPGLVYLTSWIMGFWGSFIAPVIFSKIDMLKGRENIK